jgi:hypothetical protein
VRFATPASAAVRTGGEARDEAGTGDDEDAVVDADAAAVAAAAARAGVQRYAAAVLRHVPPLPTSR